MEEGTSERTKQIRKIMDFGSKYPRSAQIFAVRPSCPVFGVRKRRALWIQKCPRPGSEYSISIENLSDASSVKYFIKGDAFLVESKDRLAPFESKRAQANIWYQ